MARYGTIGVDALANTISGTLQKYKDALVDDVNEAAKETGKSVVADIKQRAYDAYGSKGYADSWRVDKLKVRNRNAETYIVHSDDYRIAHLLEKGHATVNGGFVKGRPHIAPAEEKGIETFQELLREKVAKH